jgi:Zn-dependent peptidase ImmA (M78 family)/transcriptional regulator with XRE-family HTH domain
MFTPSRLTLARNRRGLTKKRVAELIGVTTRSVSGFEAGEMLPAADTLQRLADTLEFPLAFFEGADLEELSAEAVSFRALSKMAAADRERALAAGALAFALADWIGGHFRLPDPQVPKLQPGLEPETAAQAVRVQWGLGEKPVPNLIHLLEMRGVRVFSVTQECRELDAYSLWRGEQPFVFLNTEKSGERSRFDAAHELGHLVLHWHHDPPQGRRAELEAHRFAAAFLMPPGSLLAVAPRHPTLDQLVKIKKPWRVSVAALAYRLHALKVLSDWQYRTLVLEIGKRDYMRSEPEPIERESSQVLNKVFTALRKEGLAKADIATQLQIHPRDLDAIVFGLAMLPANSVAPRPAKPRAAEYPPLELVKP